LAYAALGYAAHSFHHSLEEKKMKNLNASTAQLVWEILNAALYDMTKGDKSDGIAAIEEAIQLMEGKSK